VKIFDTKPKPGMPVRHSTFYKALVRMARAWETLEVLNGHVDWSDGMPTIVVDPVVPVGTGKWSTDYVYVGGKKLAIPANTNSYNYLKVYLNGTTAPVWSGTEPGTPDADAEYFNMSTAPHIQLPGNSA